MSCKNLKGTCAACVLQAMVLRHAMGGAYFLVRCLSGKFSRTVRNFSHWWGRKGGREDRDSVSLRVAVVSKFRLHTRV